jgi:hypothetical protein
VLVTAALDRGDRDAARRLLELCIAALGDLGVDPSASTRSLQRRARGASAGADGKAEL